MTTLAALTEQGRWSDTRRATAEETYDEVRDLIYHTVWQMVRKHGGDFDDLLSYANEGFLKAYNSYNGSSVFSAWVHRWVWSYLIDHIRHVTKECQLYRRYENDTRNGIPIELDGLAEGIPDTFSTWRITELLEELGDDARTVISLVVETPAELNSVIQAKGDQPRNYRSSIRQYLAELGWTAARVAESFNEIRHALAE